MEPTTFKNFCPVFLAIKLNFHDLENLKPLKNIRKKRWLQFNVSTFWITQRKFHPQKDSRFFRLTAEVPEMRKCGGSSIQHVQLEARYLGGFFFSKLMKKPWIKAVVFGDFEKHVHIKKGSYKHMQVEPLASVFDLYQNHTMVPFGPTYPTSCLVPFQVTRSVSRGQVFLYQLYTGLFRSFVSPRFVD